MPKRLTGAQKVARRAAKANRRAVKSDFGRLKQAKNGRWVSAVRKRK